MTRCLVTRPAAQAGPWVAALREAGLDAEACPLIEIAPARDQSSLLHAWQRLASYDALMFVSANAVAQFFAACPAAVAVPAALIGRRYWVTGPGSAAALHKAGVPHALIDAPADSQQLDSEALWARVWPDWRPGMRVMIVRGETTDTGDPGDSGADSTSAGVGRDWLAQQITRHGGACDFVVAYRRAAPELTPQGRERLIAAASDQTVWIFSSSEALHNLHLLLPDQAWHAARAVATHPRIATQACDLGFGQVRTARPALAALIASIESWV